MLPARPNNIRFFKYRHQPINDFDYRTQFRFDDTTVQRLSDHFLGPPSNERRGRALTPKQQFKIALKYYSDPGFQAGVSEIAEYHNLPYPEPSNTSLDKFMLIDHRVLNFPILLQNLTMHRPNVSVLSGFRCALAPLIAP